MPRNKLIFNDELHREIAELSVQRVIADLFQTIGEQDVDEVGDSGAVAEPSVAIIKPILIDVVGEHCEAQMTVAEGR
jgi:hypothetical protein